MRENHAMGRGKGSALFENLATGLLKRTGAVFISPGCWRQRLNLEENRDVRFDFIMTDSAEKFWHRSAVALLGLVLTTGALAYTLPIPKAGPPAPPPQQIEITPTNASAEQFQVTCNRRNEDEAITVNVQVGLKRKNPLLHSWLVTYDGTNIMTMAPLEASFSTMKEKVIYGFAVYPKYLGRTKFIAMFDDPGDLSGSKDYWFWLESFAKTNAVR
jgi:hypothetical protein